MTTHSGGFGWRLDRYRGHARLERDKLVINIASAGWPCRALRYEIWVDDVLPQELEVRQDLWLSGIALPTTKFGFGPKSYKRLPLRPISPGFAVNTFFYAAVLWLVIPGPFALRRFIRRKRGLCPACAYPMGESTLCTECGRELPGQRAAA